MAENIEKDVAQVEEKPKNKKRKPMSGITRRWFSNTLLLIFVILIAFVILFFVLMKNYYISAIDLKLSARYSNSVADFFAPYLGSTKEKFETGAREFVANFSQKDTMEVWVIDKDGHVVISSSGFDIEDQTIPDFEQALKSDSRNATYSGKNDNGEHIRSQTYLLPTVNGEETGALRFIVSTERLRFQLFEMFMLIMLMFLSIVFLISFSGLYFIQSIVRPVNEINEISKRIAAGDLTARATPPETDDEISELCANINHMADEISSSDKMKNDFISTVSHEMKTPLTAIKGWGETLLDTGDTDPELTRRGIEVIIDESGRLTNVVNDLLDLSRIANGRMTLRTDKIDVLAELDDTIFVFKDRSMREGKELIYSVPPSPAPMVGDADRMKQVFVNVLDNAFKYTEQGGRINVVVEIEPLEEQELAEGEKRMATLKIYVVDTGCGISEEDLPKVKQKFYKSNISVKGSGIGLAVCDEIVNLHGGTLEIKSEIDVGTTVIISFPIEYVELQEDISIPEEIIEASVNQTETPTNEEEGE